MVETPRRNAHAWSLAAAALAAVAMSCARNPVTGDREIMLISESQEIAMGREAAQQIPRQLGLLDDEAWQGYLNEQGLRIARDSERPDLPWEFRVVDSPVVNAFALPGGFIYFTRGILAHMNSEAEMIGVLGHEIGHVTARHSAQQLSRAQLANVGLGLGMIFVPEVRPFGDVLQGSLGLLFLRFGRDDETQSDRLGVRYAANAGYDPRAMADFFQIFQRMRESSGQAIPSWLSTHPEPEDRRERILEWSRAFVADGVNLETGEEELKKRLEGLVHGENPREGFMDENVFKHPDLRFQIVFPETWRVQNTKAAVFAGSDNAAFRLTASGGSGGRSPEAAAADFFRGQQVEVGRGRSRDISGFSAYIAPFRVRAQGGTLQGDACFLRDGEMMYELIAYTTSSRYRGLGPVFHGIFESFSRLRDRRALEAEPQRMTLYRVPRGTSARQALLDSGVVEEQLEEVALLNNLTLDETVPEGHLLKSVTPANF